MMYRLATKCTTKKRVEETRVCISLYRLLTVEQRDLISSSLVMLQATLEHVNLVKSRNLLTYPLSGFVSAFRNGRDPIFPFQPLMGLKL